MLERYHDGDLSDAERRLVEAGLNAHPDAQSDLDDLSLIGEVLRETADEAAGDYDPGRIWAGVASKLDSPAPAAASADAPSILEQLVQWFTPPRLVPLGALAAAAMAWMVVSGPGPQTPGTTPGTELSPSKAIAPEVARSAPPKPPPTAVAQVEAEEEDDIIIDSIEAEDADILIGKTDGDDPSTVIWLLADADIAADGGTETQSP